MKNNQNIKIEINISREVLASFVLIIAIIAVWIYEPEGKPEFQEGSSVYQGPYEVVKIVDGDTIKLNINDEVTSVRLIGIDTPESVHPNKEKNVPEGKLAAEHTKALTADKYVYIEYGEEAYDRYGRVLAYVYIDKNTMLNAQLVEDGYAEVYTIKPNNKYEDYFLNLEEKAKKNNSGLWSTGVFDN